MAIGALRCVVFDVTDLEVAEAFWSEVTGLEVIGSSLFGDRFSYLGEPGPWKHEVILQKRDTEKGDAPNRSHVDITPAVGIDDAIERIVALGGSVRKEPSLFPRPGSMPGRRPVIDWAVMRDPSCNEFQNFFFAADPRSAQAVVPVAKEKFCLVEDLSREQSEAVLAAADLGATDDHSFRVAAGVTK